MPFCGTTIIATKLSDELERINIIIKQPPFPLFEGGNRSVIVSDTIPKWAWHPNTCTWTGPTAKRR
jgi:hypothetical protein